MRPKDVAADLGVSGATLRTWSREFGAWLSASARPALNEAGQGVPRVYTAADVAVLRAAGVALRERLTFDAVRARLGAPSVSMSDGGAAGDVGAVTAAEPVPSASMAVYAALQLALDGRERALSAVSAHLADVRAERDRALARVAELEAAAAARRPWWPWWPRRRT